MASGSMTVKLRPIKIAFLVNIRDKKALLEAIEINTFLWGGVYNPIIPFFKNVPKNWEDHRAKSLRSEDVITGYLEAFDPEYVVALGECAKEKVNIGSREMVLGADILSSVKDDGVPNYGIGLFEVLNYFISKELKYVRRRALDINILEFDKKTECFLASMFGSLPDDIRKILKDHFESRLESVEQKCSLRNFVDYMSPQKLFLRRFTSLYIEKLNLKSYGRDSCVFFLDANNTMDIIDFWNLRAIGWSVVPVPKQAASDPRVKTFVGDFIEQNYYPYRNNPNIYHHTTFVKSRNVAEQEMSDFAKSLSITKSDPLKNPKYLLQRWYPRIWDEWARDKDGVSCCELETDTRKYDLANYKEQATFLTLDPKFINRYGGMGHPRFANDVELRLYSDKEIFAEVLPEGDQGLVRAIGGIGFRDWRFSRKGLVYLSEHTKWQASLSLPKSEDVFVEWLKSKGWTIELSSPGCIAKQMAKQLNGVWGITTLAKEGVIKLLEKFSEGKILGKEAFFAEIHKIANQEKYFKDPKRLLENLMDAQMFRLGMELQCPVCKQRTWYTISDADYELQCYKCLEKFQIPSSSPDDIKWAYRAFGPFSLPNQAYGVYSVLLTWRFFSRILDGATTPLFSFLAKKDDFKGEADLGILFNPSKFGEPKTELILAECKTYNAFDQKDVTKMARLARQFPGAVIVFATLKPSLTDKEKSILRPIVEKGRKYWKAERPFNPVLILTGTELFGDFGSPETIWKEAGGKHASFAAHYKGWKDLIELCDATQQLYLDMKPWHEWLRERWERKQQKKQVMSAQPAIDNATI